MAPSIVRSLGLNPPGVIPDSPRRLKLGRLAIDQLDFEQAMDSISRLVEAKQGGFVFTPNVDHIVLVETETAFREAYEAAQLSLVDGMPIVWASHLLGVPLAERISGSDLVLPLMKRAAERGWRVYLLGAGPGVAAEAAERIRRDHPVDFVGIESPMVKVGQGVEANRAIVEKIRQAKPDLLFVALGSPKQEIWIHEIADQIRPTVAIGVGAAFDFIAGKVPRAPRWVSRAGLEWLYRLTREPKRLWRRYLLNDPKFLAILVRELRSRARA